MKCSKIIVQCLMLFAASLAFTGCLKQPYEIDFTDNTKRLLTEFKEGKDGFIDFNVDAAPGTVSVNLAEIRAVTRSEFNSPYTVKLRLNPGLVTAYNAENGTSFTVPGSSVVNLPTMEYTISPQQRSLPIKANVMPNSLTGDSYAIGLTIESVSNGQISDTAKNVVIAISAKNEYDAEYRVVGTQVHYGGPTTAAAVTATYNINTVMRFKTINANTIQMETGDISITDAYHNVTIDPATNNVTITADPVLSFPVTENNGPSSYDPVAKKFTLNYRYFNSSGRIRVIQTTATRL